VWAVGVLIQNLNPDVLMIEPAEDWYRSDAADLPASARTLEHPYPMTDVSDFVVIRRVSLEDVAQVRLAKHDQVVEGFATDRSDEPLNVAVLP
jgi:hypothetical protein